MSHDLSYFSGPNTSGAKKNKIINQAIIILREILTSIVRSVAGRLQSVFNVSFLSEAKIRQLYDCITVR